MRDSRIRNVIWITTDVHYTAAHYYNPEKAQFKDFDPFWEFVSGPLNAGTFGPNNPDNTFGIEVVYQKYPAGVNPDRSPRAGMQFFGKVQIDRSTKVLTVRLCDVSGAVLYTKELPAFTAPA